MTLTEMQEKRGRLVSEARERLDQIKSNTEESRVAELESQHDAAMAELDKLDASIKREQDVAAMEARQAELEQRQREQRRPNMDGRQEQRDADAPSYSQVFYKNLRSKAPDSGIVLTDEERAILARGEVRAQTTTAAAGGYTVPQDLLNVIVESMIASGPMYDPGVTFELMTSSGNKITMPTINDTASTAGAHTEGATLTDDGGKDFVFGEKQLDAFEYDTEWVRFSKALLDDSDFNIQQVGGRLLGKRMGRLANNKLTVGTGSSEPNGIVTASTAGNVAAATNAITADEIIDLVHSVDPAYRSAQSVRFMFHDSTLAAIRKLKDGQGNYLWQMGNVQQGVPGNLLGYNYSINQDMAQLTSGVSSRVMVFGDFQSYFVRKVGTPLIGAISDKDFWPGIGIAGYIRFDGELSDTAAVKHLALAAA